MARIAWSTAGSRFYEAGVDRGVLYVDTLAGVPWIGLIGVDEAPSGGEAVPRYIDGEKYLNLAAVEEFNATIRAYTYPVEFAQCDGSARVRNGLFFGQQRRNPFGFSYRTKVGNDVDGPEHGYKIHLVYNALATPSSRAASTFADSVDPSDFSWTISTKSRRISGYSSTAYVVVDSRYTHPTTLMSIEDILYGTESTISRLPTPEEIIDIFDIPVMWEVIDNEDGSYRIADPGSAIVDLGLGMFSIDHENVVAIDEDTYTISS